MITGGVEKKEKVIDIQDELMRKEWEIFWNAKQNSQFTKISWSKIRIMRILDKYVIKGMTALDAGSGSGFFSNYFVSKGCKAYSLDYSKKALEITKRITRDKSFKYLNRDLLDVNLGSEFKNMFDLIFTDGLFEHFASKKREQIMGNFLAMKRREGIIITFVPNKYSFWRLIKPIFMGRIEEKPFTLKELTLLVRNTGQKIIENSGINVLPIKYSPEILGKDIGMLIYTVSK